MAKSKRIRGRRLLDFPSASPRTQYAQGLVKGLPHLERRRSRQLEQHRYEDAQGRRQEDLDRRLSELDEKKLQGAADAVMDFLTKKDVAPETRERILDQLPDQIKKRMPFMPEGELYKPEDPLFEKAKRRRAEDALEEERPLKKREREREAAEKKEEKAKYKEKKDRAYKIAHDDTSTVEGRVIAIKQIGLRSGDEKAAIGLAKIPQKPPVHKPEKPPKATTHAQLNAHIANLMKDKETLIDWAQRAGDRGDKKTLKTTHKQIEEISIQIDKALAERSKLQFRLPGAQGPPPAPPLTPQTAPSAQTNEQTPDSEKVWQEIYNDLDAQGKAMVEALLAKGKSKQEIMRRLGY